MRFKTPHAISLLAFGIIIIATLVNCKKEDDPKPVGTLLLNRLSLAMVPGKMENVIISTENNNIKPGILSFTSDNPDIAQISLNSNILSVKGLQYGKTNITISNSNGSDAILPVVVYNHKQLETEELYISFTETFEFRRSYWYFGAVGYFYHPNPPDGFHALGSLGISWPQPNGKASMMVVKAKKGSDALAHPVSYNHIGQAIYEPVPPEGYVALGMVVHTEDTPPPLTDIVCVRKDLTIPGECSSEPFSNLQEGSTRHLYWDILSPDSGPHSNAYLTPGTFLMTVRWHNEPILPPTGHKIINVLKVNLPILSEAPYQSFVPKLEGHDTPPEKTIPLFSRAMLVPYTTVKDIEYLSDPGWRIQHSPMYVLEREVYYKRIFHNHNQTSVLQTHQHITRTGVSVEESNTYWTETGISLSVEAGVSIKAFEAKVTATVSKSFGHSSQTSVGEFSETEINKSINTPPGKSVTLWQQYNRYILYRHNGHELEPVASGDFGIESFVLDEYPK